MKKIRTVVCVLLLGTMAIFFASCAVIESIATGDMNNSSESVSETDSSSSKTKSVDRIVDDTIEEPVFSNGLGYVVHIAQGNGFTMYGTAAVDDGGEITYQWYISNTKTNGGGTAIEGATEETYSVDTSEVGIKYYYVVVSNNHDERYNMTVSDVAEFDVISAGEWVTDEFGGTRYIGDDGTYPIGIWVFIDGYRYLFDENGYRITGWHLDGDTYKYFDEEGKYKPDQVLPEGASVDENGNIVEAVSDENQAEGTTQAAEETEQETAPVAEEAAEAQQ